MAKMRSSLSFEDGASPVLNTINKNANTLLQSFEKLNEQTKNIQGGFDSLSSSHGLNQLNQNVRKAREQTDELERSADRTTKALQGMSAVKFAVLIRALKQIKQLLTGITDTVDELTTSLAVISNYNFSNVAAEDLTTYLYAVSKATRTELQQTASIAQDLLSTGLFQGENAAISAIRTTEIVNQAVIGSGATGRQAEQAATQLSNALARGELSTLNITSLLKTAPKFVDYIAQGFNELGYTVDATRYSIRDLAKDGQVTADRVIKALHAVSGQIEEDFNNMPITFSQVYSSFKSTWQFVLTQLNQTNGPLQKILKQFQRISDWLGSNDSLPFWNAVAIAIEAVAFALELAINLISAFFGFIADNSSLVLGVLAAMATLIAVDIVKGLGKAIVNFLTFAAAGSTLNIVFTALAAVIGVVIFALSAMGVETEEIFGIIGRAVGWVGRIIGSMAVTAIHYLGSLVLNFASFIEKALNSVASLFASTEIIAEDTSGFLKAVFADAGQSILDNLKDKLSTFVLSIAAAVLGVTQVIDSIFGSNLSSSVEKFIVEQSMNYADNYGNPFEREAGSNIDKWVSTLSEDLQDAWRENWSWKDEESNIDKMIEDFDKWYDESLGFFEELPDTASQTGKDIYRTIKDMLDNINLDTELSEELLSIIQDIDDGNLDIASIGEVGVVDEIKNDVNIADEDLRLFKDIAADRYRAEIRNIDVNIEMGFGDINNNGDIDDILDRLAEQLEEKVAVTLIN